MSEAQREMTFGEKAVGLSYGLSANPAVTTIKINVAEFIDQMDDLRNTTPDPEVKRMASVAITEAQTAQMWAVKAITWQL